MVPNQKVADLIASDINLFNCFDKFIDFPEWTQEPFEEARVLPKILSKRAAALDKFINLDEYITILTPYSILKKVPSIQLFSSSIVTIKKMSIMPQSNFENSLDLLGYVRVEFVSGIGEYTTRGDILDIFPSGRSNPIRLEYFDDEIEKIYSYDYETQSKIEDIDTLKILPASEMIISTKDFQSSLSEYEKYNERADSFGKFAGSHWLQPLLSIKSGTIFDYIKDAEFFILDQDIRETLERESYSIKDRLGDNNLAHKLIRNFIDYTEAFKSITTSSYSLITDVSSGLDSESLNYSSLISKFIYEKVNIYSSLAEAIKILKEYLDKKYKVVVSIDSEQFYNFFINFIKDYEIPVSIITDMSLADNQAIYIYREPVSGGFIDSGNKTILVTDLDIFGYAKRKRKKEKKKDVFNTKISDLEDGDYVVHINHGIGVYRGLNHMMLGEVEGDFLEIAYEGEDRLYVPLQSITMVQKYIGIGNSAPRINSLKTSAWQKLKKHAKKSAKEVAVDLLRLYAERKAKKGYSFIDDGVILSDFEGSFPYDETEDQLTAIMDIYSDMESEIPMERLVCGDVGFGKTEVAMRAACKAIISDKQVAVLVPTTILAKQHYDTFKNRFGGLAANVDYISRFRSGAEIKTIYKKLSDGEIDIIIGTHKLLSKDVIFKDLGLLVIDEEQRFGVNHKEKLSALKRNVDTLALSATPIPRTLQLSLSGIRDISIIETPPEHRLPVIVSIINNYDDVKEAIVKELKRDGQVFFLHNRISDIISIHDKIKAIVPEASIAIAHGQMNSNELEKILQLFYSGEIDILISTTIIENGIDIPNVNTIIINKAGSFGLSQLYQLKGRVGRSTERGYCYLLIENFSSLTDIAQKRLTIVEQLSDLGSGFKIAMYDLQLRGAGDILGADQSGFVVKIGYELYVKMIDDAVNELKGSSGTDDITDCEILSQLPYFIPVSYIENPRIRFDYYRQFSLYDDPLSIVNLLRELTESYGELPLEVINLSNIMLIKTIASKLGVIKISIGERSGKIIFSKDTKVSYENLVNKLNTAKMKYRFKSEYELDISIMGGNGIVELTDIFVNLYSGEVLS